MNEPKNAPYAKRWTMFKRGCPMTNCKRLWRPTTALDERTQASIAEGLDQLQAALAAHRTALDERTQASIAEGLDQLQAALAAHRTALDERTQASIAEGLDQLQAALAAHRTALDEQVQTVLNQGLATLRQESRKTRNLLIGIAAGLGAVSVAIMIAGILIL